MKKLQPSQARAVVGGGFFKSLFKISTGAAILGAVDPVTAAVAGSTYGGGRVAIALDSAVSDIL